MHANDLTESELDSLLKTFDKTDRKIQRLIVAQALLINYESKEKLALWEEMRAVLEKAKEMRGHYHWDRTMKHGAGCELCVKQSSICAEIDAILFKANAIKQKE